MMLNSAKRLAAMLPLVLAFVLLIATAPLRAQESDVPQDNAAQAPAQETETPAIQPAPDAAPAAESFTPIEQETETAAPAAAPAPTPEKPYRPRHQAAAPVATPVSAPAAAPIAPAVTAARQIEAPPPTLASSGVKDYVLDVGDKLRINVFGEPDLTGEFEVSSTGTVSMPLIGEVRAAGETVTKLQASITARLLDGYMKDPKVSVEVNNYRPFFIVGEVMKPGSYTFVNGMTVINAVALAGGYTYRADKSGITLKHGGTTAREAPVPEDAAVLPGDVIRVPERFF